MESFLHAAHSVVPHLHKWGTSAAFPHFIPPAASFRAIRRTHPLTWVLVGKDIRTFLPRADALVDGDGHTDAQFADGWSVMEGHRKEEWLAMDAKGLLSHCVETWGLPVAFGATLGSLIAQRRLVFFAFLSFTLLMVVHKVLQHHKGQDSHVFPKQAFTIILTEAKSWVSSTLLSLHALILPLRAAVQMILSHISLNLTIAVASVSSLVASKSTHRVSLSLKEAWSKGGMSLSTSKSNCTSPDSILTDIGLCIDNVESMSQEENVNMGKLRENLALLKVKLAELSSKSYRNPEVASTSGGGVLTPPSAPGTNSQPGKSKRLEVDKLLANKWNKLVEEYADSNAQISEQEDSRQTAQDLGVVNVIADGPVATSDNTLGYTSLTGPALGMEACPLAEERKLYSGEGNTMPPLSHNLIGSQRSGVNRIGRRKYVDYWIEQDQNGAADVSSLIASQSGSEGQNMTDRNFKNTRKNGFGIEGGQAILRDQDIGAYSSNADKRNVWVNEAPQPGSIRPEDASDRSNVPRADQSNEEQGIERKSLSLEESKTESKGVLNGSAKELSSPQQNVNENHQNGYEMDLSGALFSSSKELPFAREDPGMHALTGVTKRRNDEEFQKFMTEGEASLKDGKAGLNRKMEVGEVETRLCKAAKAFASAAAIDESSIEALGFWGNTLLVHGELKLNMSRDLRQLISTPDVISSYQTRKSKTVEPYEMERLAALRQSFEAVSEECEELLIQAGRKYRMVLSIDNGEVRALYNWGLALCFRAELIAEEGGQSALEAADRVYLAAVDKFEAMMGISRRYAPAAMLNWGLILRARSRLHPMGSLERLDLLQQAKQLLQDASRLQPDDAQIRGTFTMCSEELMELREKQGMRSRRNRSSFFGIL